MDSSMVSSAAQAAAASGGSVISNALLTGGITMACLACFYFVRLLKNKKGYTPALLGWCILAFFMLLVINFAVRINVVAAAVAVACGLAAGACIIIPIYMYRKKHMTPEQAQEQGPAQGQGPIMDYGHFVAERLLNIGLHHVEFVENPEETGYTKRAKDSYTQKVCVRAEFSPSEIDVDAVRELAAARDRDNLKRSLFFTNAAFTDEAKEEAEKLSVELLEHFRK